MSFVAPVSAHIVERVVGLTGVLAVLADRWGELERTVERIRLAVAAGGYPESAYRAFVARWGSRAEAIAVFARERDGRLISLGAEFGHPAEVAAIRPAAAEAVGIAVRREARARPVVAGPFIDGRIAKAFGRGFGAEPVRAHVPVVRIEEHRDPRHYLSDNRDRSLRRIRNRVQREGIDVRALALRGDEALTVVPAIREIKVERSLTHRDDVVLAPGRLELWERRLRTQLSRGAARLDVLLIQGEVAAYDVSLVDGETWRVSEGCSAERWRRFAPGRLLELHLLATAIDSDGTRVLDWMTSGAPEAILAANDGYATLTFSHAHRGATAIPCGRLVPSELRAGRVPSRGSRLACGRSPRASRTRGRGGS